MFFRRKKEFEYGELSRIGLTLALSLYYTAAYDGERVFDLLWDKQLVDLILDEFKQGKSRAREPKPGLPGHENAKLLIYKDLSTDYGFRLRIIPNDAGCPEGLIQKNLEAKLRVEQAWRTYDLPFEE